MFIDQDSRFLNATSGLPKSVLNTVKTSGKKVAVIGGTFVAGSGVASADTAAVISDAFSAGQSNVQLAAAGIVALVAVVTGLGLIVSMLRK